MASGIPLSKPWMHSNSSNTSLKGMEIAIPPGQERPLRPHPPPSTRTQVASKPLPPIPLRRSISSSFSHEMHETSQGRTGDVVDRRPSATPNWYRQEADISVMLEGRISQHQKQASRRGVDSAFCPMPGEIISPQPVQPIRKVWHGRGVAATATSSVSSSIQSSSPSGHNPSQKMRQLTGLEMHSPQTLPAEQPDSPVVGTSSSSSVYSLEMPPPMAQGSNVATKPAIHVAQCLASESPIIRSFTPNKPNPGVVPLNLDGKVPSGGSVLPSFCRHDCVYCQHSPVQADRQAVSGLNLYGTATTPNAQNRLVPEYEAPGLFTEPRKPPIIVRTDRSPKSPGSPGLSVFSSLRNGFADRVNRSKVRMAPPANLPAHRTGGRFGAVGHPLRTPYPPRSVFEDDDSDGEDDAALIAEDSPKRKSSSSSALVGRLLRHGSGLAGPTLHPSAAQRDYVLSDQPWRVSERVTTVPKPTSPSTPKAAVDLLQRTGEQAKGLMSQAMKKVQVKSKAERRRDELRSKIRVISEADASLPGAFAADGTHGMETRHWL
ncbi:uncharacterized protein E0L32_009610 [Thyridium curvatum]|uniref:Uncharacterized protein n=1 Tax=Thyridium curvatum TaxID=1093900 RepID=A0A507AQE9_9PEZI|nr:uncharacterized protein E0L32_009610 [Thyridium curvatum]TPX08906.1 hypothetical protein E0L32_009610 [Thyridium curvatum]